MARLPALITALASTDGRERPTLEVIARTIREAGLIATTKRGSGASEMTVNDAVNFIIGANAVQSPRLAAVAVQQYRTFKQSPHGRGITGQVFGQLAQADTLPDALAVLVREAFALDDLRVEWVQRNYGRYEPYTDWVLKPSLSVSFSAAQVVIDYQEFEWRFQWDANLMGQRFYTTPGEGVGRRVTTTVLFPTFVALHHALFGDAETAAGSPTGAP